MIRFSRINFQGSCKIYENSEIYCPRKIPTIRYAKLSFETKLAKDIQQNSTLFWKYVRNSTKVYNMMYICKLVKEDTVP